MLGSIVKALSFVMHGDRGAGNMRFPKGNRGIYHHAHVFLVATLPFVMVVWLVVVVVVEVALMEEETIISCR